MLRLQEDAMDATLHTVPATTSHRHWPLRIRWPIAGLGAAIARLTAAIGHAATMAYVDPYRRVSAPSPTNEADSRDPNW